MVSGDSTQASLFDKSQEYDALLNQGLVLTGESKQYFAVHRIRDLRQQLAGFTPNRILDFGCGIGDTAVQLAAAFPDSEVVGIDSAAAAVSHAHERFANERITFLSLDTFEPRGDFDLCYCSGVFHHVPRSERSRALRLIGDALAPEGRLALFENNPWNPGTRVVMKRIPFDADADPLTPYAAAELLRATGWSQLGPPRFLFYFPRWLAPLRRFEPRLVHIPFGGQYYLLSVKRAAAAPGGHRSHD
jgi:SAM-dependent methyltransferase